MMITILWLLSYLLLTTTCVHCLQKLYCFCSSRCLCKVFFCGWFIIILMVFISSRLPANFFCYSCFKKKKIFCGFLRKESFRYLRTFLFCNLSKYYYISIFSSSFPPQNTTFGIRYGKAEGKKETGIKFKHTLYIFKTEKRICNGWKKCIHCYIRWKGGYFFIWWYLYFYCYVFTLSDARLPLRRVPCNDDTLYDVSMRIIFEEHTRVVAIWLQDFVGNARDRRGAHFVFKLLREWYHY